LRSKWTAPFRAIERWVWLAREDSKSAFRVGVLVAFGMLAVVVCASASIFAIFVLYQASTKDELGPQAKGRRAEIQRFMDSRKLSLEERAVGNSVLACIDGATTTGTSQKSTATSNKEPASSHAAGAEEDPVVSLERSCTGKLISDVAIANGTLRAQQIVTTLTNMGFDIPETYR